MRLFVTLGFLILASACGKHQVGEDCSASSDCATGTSCIQSGSQEIMNETLACTDKKVCSLTCAQDADCSSLGTGYICISDCYSGSCFTGTRG